ncbi:MAG TPA: PQQ-binding-like beta-propeller repeat protein [Rhizomicrobium sp.]|nr:PQQ-binding-like beta-propeller repeat protein [Rhizomicrobium sp.]
MKNHFVWLSALMAGALLLPAAAQNSSAPDDWTSWGYDQQRTGWNKGETILTPQNVAHLGLQWSAKLSTPVDVNVLSTVTAPVIVQDADVAGGKRNLLFLLGADDTLFALDADSGKVLWQKTFANPLKPQQAADWLCPNTANDTPVIDKARGIVFFIASDGKLRGLNLADGAERLTPIDMVAPFTRAWSLNLIDNVVYTTSGRACGEVLDKNSAMYDAAVSVPRGRVTVLIDPSAVTAVNVKDLAHPQVTRFYTSGARPAAPWGRGGLSAGPNGSVILETSDGLYDPAAGNYSESILKLSGQAARLVDSYTPQTWRFNLAHDLSGSATPVVFDFGGKTLIATAQKEGILRLLDAGSLGGANHMTPLYQSPRLGNDIAQGTDPSSGIWGGIATYQTNDGKRFLYFPMWGPPSAQAPAFPQNNGAIANGSIMAFQVTADGGKIAAAPAWTSPDLIMPDPPVVANGVVYAFSTGGQRMQNFLHPGEPRMAHSVSAVMRSKPVSNLTVYALDAQTGKPLWSSKNMITDWVHFSEPVVALGKVFVVTHDAHVYAFGLKR